MRLVAVDDDHGQPLPPAHAVAVLNEHWKSARAAYADVLGAVGDHYLRQLVVPPTRSLNRSHMAELRDRARLLAQHATRVADALDQALEVYRRVDHE